MIEIKGLTYNYGEKLAVNKLDLKVSEGEIHGLIGPDGAGKTTTMRVLTSLMRIQEGSASISGVSVQNYREIRNKIGYMPQRFSLYPDLSVAENLDFFANIFLVSDDEKKEREDVLYSFSGLRSFQDRPAGKLSGGMKQKLALMCALIHQPEVLILDEPTTGVDPVSREDFWDILHQVKKTGIPILVSTPYMDEVEKCDTVTLMNNGCAMRKGKPFELSDEIAFSVLNLKWLDQLPNHEFLSQIPGYIGIQPFGKSYHLYIKNQSAEIKTINYCRNIGLNPGSTEFHVPGIEDIFIYYMEYHNE